MCITLLFVVIQCVTLGQDLSKIQKEVEKQRETNRIRNKIIKALQFNGIASNVGPTGEAENGPTIKHIPHTDEVHTEPDQEPVLVVIGEPACEYNSFIYCMVLFLF